MFDESRRIKKDKDFDRLFKRGKSVAGNGFIMRFVGNDKPMTRFGFSVGLKFSKKAVARNRARRRFSEAAKELIGALEPGYDIVIIPKKAPEPKFQELVCDLAEAFKKAGILKK